MQATTAVAVTSTALIPKKYIDVRNAGTSAINTPYMHWAVDSPLCICGEGETTNLFMLSI